MSHTRFYTNTARQGTEHPSKLPISLTQTHRTALGFVLLYEILSKHLTFFPASPSLSLSLSFSYPGLDVVTVVCAALQGFIALIGLDGTVESWKSYSCPGL